MNRPDLYSKHNEAQAASNKLILKNYGHLIKWNNTDNNLETILDIGCGEGRSTIEILLPKLPKNFSKLIGCDVSNQMVNFAKEIYDEKYFPRVEFRQCDASGENIEDVFMEKFNHVFSFLCLHWIQNQKRVFENIYKLLKPGGDILLSFLSDAPLYQIFENLSKHSRWATHYRKNWISPYYYKKHPAEDVKLLLNKIGFKNCFCTIEIHKFIYNTFDDYKNAMMAINPIIALIPPNEKKEYIEELVNEMKTYFYLNYKDLMENNDKEKFATDHKLIVVYASKPMK